MCLPQWVMGSVGSRNKFDVLSVGLRGAVQGFILKRRFLERLYQDVCSFVFFYRKNILISVDRALVLDVCGTVTLVTRVRSKNLKIVSPQM